MSVVGLLVRYIYTFLDSFSFLVIAALGLATIFGMMKIVNQAHGEFIMLGAYIFTLLVSNGVPFILGIILSTCLVAVFGFIIDRLIICRLYDRPMDSIVVTWGISLAMVQIMRLIFGSVLGCVGIPLGSIEIAGSVYSIYKMILIVISVILLIGFYFIFAKTKFGLYSRATMQKAEIAETMGINTKFTYSATFMIGSGLAGLCGALYAPTMNVTPDMGTNFIVQAFTTVVVGGGDPLVGTVMSASALGFTNGIVSLEFGSFIGKVAMLAAAILCIRIMPEGFSGMVEKIRMKRRSR